MKLRRHLFALLAGVIAALGLMGGTAALGVTGTAVDSAAKLSVRKVDSTDPSKVKVSLIYNGARSDLRDLTLRENGVQVKSSNPVPLRKAGVNVATVFVVDTSRSMGINGGLRQAKQSIARVIKAKQPLDAVGIVGFGTTARSYVDLTSDGASALAALDRLGAPSNASTALWDGVKRGAGMLGGLSDLQPNMVLVTDGFDDSSVTKEAQARSQVLGTGAAVFALGYNQQKQVDKAALQRLVGAAGGQFVYAPRANDLDAALKDVQTSLENQYVVEYRSNAVRGVTNLAVSAGGVTDTSSFVIGSVSQGGGTLPSTSGGGSFLPSFLTTSTGLLLIAGVLGVAVALFVLALALLATKDETALQTALRAYAGGGAEGDGADPGMAQTAFIQRAVELTGEFADRQGLLAKCEAMLEQADLPLRAAEAMFFYAVGVILMAIVGLALGGIFGFLLAGGFSALVPIVVLRFLGSRRRKKFMSSLPDMLQLLSGSLRAGYSLMQGVEAVSQEVGEPMGKELRRVVTEARLGRELEESLEGVADRMQSADFAWAVMAIGIQREVGGNLSELLLTVAETMVERERLRRDVSALTAEGRISALVLGLLPVGLGGAISAFNPDYIKPLFGARLGQFLLGLGITSMLIGLAWMKKIISIEI
ncbi:MAG: type II secretion system F family protein [Actinobacteria bacterium]|nr:type II secretion system F family protein [Actinomycetota bacterium]